LLDVDTAEVPNNSNETPNTFGRNLLRRLGIPHDHTEAEAASTHPPLITQNFETDEILSFGDLIQYPAV